MNDKVREALSLEGIKSIIKATPNSSSHAASVIWDHISKYIEETENKIIDVEFALQDLKNKDPWQPIETLKAKEGAYQLWHKRYGWIPSAQYVKDMRTHGGSQAGWLAHKDNTCYNEKEITHWQPLPEPPEKK